MLTCCVKPVSRPHAKTETMPRVNHEILKWARESAGLSLDEAARALGLGGAKAVARLADMEAGEREPTRRQLTKMAEKYRRPILAFYLTEPPAPGPRVQDFRTLRDRPPGSQPLIDALVRNVTVRQALIRSALADVEEEEPLPFVGSMRVEQGPEAIARAMAATLQVDLADYRAKGTIDEAFRFLREAVERAGVYVILMGNLGHHSTKIDPKVFRGFALADLVAPFIVINENDSRSAWTFTLLHELAHVFLGQGGISGYDGDERIEQVCDRAAADFLLRPEELKQLRARELPMEELLEAAGTFAVARKVSRKMVAYNLLKIGEVTRAVYQQLSEHFDRERLESAQRRPGGAVDYYVVRRHRIGAGLTRLVERLVAAGALTSPKAGRVLGVKATAVGKMTAGPQAA